MAEPAGYPANDKPGWIKDEHTELKPAEVTKDEMNQLSDTTLALDKLSDTNLEIKFSKEKPDLNSCLMKEPKPILNGPRSCSKTEEVFPKSSLVSVFQVSGENSAERAQKSSPPEEVLEQPNNIEVETDAKSFSLNSQEHCKDLDMANYVSEMFVMHTELKPVEVTKDKFNLLSDTSLELDKLSDTNLELDELSDANLDLDELSDTEKGVGLGAGRNEPFQPKKKSITSLLWNCVLPSPSILLQTIRAALRNQGKVMLS
ncbi:hypothetical protein F2Q69_00007204 [Brassica cretica]|uniref:Uncharacterized protein n=1 Tax=Brassica cretica TaxID=69181 RepID=A0A8S9P9H4_BRACR|nr:hypothetical protein F2Q69_00007204 [Brassica cretica]